MSEVLTCPHCGGEAAPVQITYGHEPWVQTTVVCDTCGARSMAYVHKRDDKALEFARNMAIEGWNRRYDPPARLVTKEDLAGSDRYGNIPAWHERRDSALSGRCWVLINEACLTPEHAADHRYWTKPPTEEQMRDTPWTEKEDS